MADPQPTPFGLAQTLLVDYGYRGLFIGERHDIALVPDFLITHMEDFRAMGVTTLYIEMDHGLIAASSVGPDCVEGYEGPLAEGESYAPASRENDYAQVIQHAQSLGIRVIGTERGYDTNAIADAAYSFDTETGETGPTSLGTALYYSAEAMEGRDAFAADLIRATFDGGRFIVYGGAHHSRDTGADPNMPSPGVDRLLGIPSIDLMARGDYELAYTAEGALDAVATLYGAAGAAIRNLTDPAESTIIRAGTSGRGDFIAAPEYFGSTRYPERNTALTDAPLPPAPPLPPEITNALMEAGVCHTPASDSMVRTQEDLPQLQGIIDTQYTR